MALANPHETICALSTTPGTGAIAVIRISGQDAFPICGKLFNPSDKRFSFSTSPSHSIHHGSISCEEQLIDEVLISIFKTPNSYTGEDVAEISCHGSEFIQQQIIDTLVDSGCRLATPGEFTLRGFLNGKFDLSQAEAVADLIASGSQSSHDLALAQMRGGFSKKIKELRQKLLEFTSLIELELDFSEEDVKFASRSDLLLLLDEMKPEVSRLIHSFSLGNVIKKGIPVAIIGKPNVGKSTLLNTLLNEEKAIVSETPGTTRDAIEDTIVLDGFSFRFIDTAGLRAAENHIETMGIDRTWSKIEHAAIILYLFDATRDSYQAVRDALAEFENILKDPLKRLILIGNKMDLLSKLPKGFQDFVEQETIFVSAKRKENIHLIAESLMKTVENQQISGGAIVSNTRHLEALKRTLEAVENIHDGLQSGTPPDLLTIDIRQALHHLGEITGEITTDEILGTIFSRFCIGK
ncbi:MAG: tRNA uridine-5-carboxymethylaminomethyl(34) synthesis GTPase MnmE [Bacteroidales bacterium]|nr:tRNA uridine-5-carboxymethylaminomethyl(34) synthesis GTPase MnmE [Bacteroidota bacterium]MBL6949430.1 tRNA uridine-5-carboxymethylaminomethyl(34) synthesis GTPase MnmE [Bacteroidales bacterium]